MDYKTKIYASLVWLLIVGTMTTSCSKDDEGGGETPPSEERYTGDTYKDLHSPWVKDPSQTTHLTRWDCILFGSYPANEVVSGSFNAVDGYALAQGDVIVDAALFNQLENASYRKTTSVESTDVNN